MTQLSSSAFRFGPGVVLTVRGNRAAVRHLAGEYEAAAVEADAEPDLEIAFGRLPHETGPGGRFVGGHKTVAWRVALGAPDERPLRASLDLRGRPRSFALSLVQGYVIEALLGVAAARRGVVLLPAAALEQDGGALVLLGPSRSGKSSLMARALAAGRTVLGDDQLLVDESGRCWAFPRRMRLYPDLRLTAPAAYQRLGARARLVLAARRLGRVASGGYVAPSLPLSLSGLGAPPPSGPLPLRTLVLIERGAAGARAERHPLHADEALEMAQRVIAEQRAGLEAPPGAWRDELRVAADRERETLAQALRSVPVERVTIPGSLDAAEAVEALARLLRVEA